MQNYINQLIGDLRTAKKNVPPDTELEKTESYEEFDEKMLAIETAPNVSAKNLFGVSYKELPPSEKLTDKQMQQITDAIIYLWSYFNIDVDFRENMPIKLRYELAREKFSEDIHYMPGWSMTYDFCSGWCPDCKIIDYCDSWEDNWTREELEKEKLK
jgi:hypothetical protein